MVSRNLFFLLKRVVVKTVCARLNIPFRRLLACVLALVIGLSSTSVFACGPFNETVVFEYSDHPDPPFTKFALGELGIIRPTFARSYLIVAYRYLSGQPLESIEQKAALKLWKDRLIPSPDDDSHLTARENWLKARAQITDSKPEINLYKTYSDYSEFLNYTAGAFDCACQTLKMYVSKYGAKSKETELWLQAQDKVFDGTGIPDVLADSTAVELKAERAYQTASAEFYKGNYDQAASDFKKISENTSSRWHILAPYLAARALIRKGTVTSGKSDLVALRQAYMQLESILENPSLSTIHKQTRDLLQFVGMKVDSQSQIREILNRLSVASHAATFGRDLNDSTKLLDHMSSETDIQALPVASVGNSDLGMWLAVFQRKDADSASLAMSSWRKFKSLPWLICALSKTTTQGAKISPQDEDALLSAARKVNEKSAGYMSVLYYAANLFIKSDCKSALLSFEKMLKRPNLSPSARNLFLNKKLMAEGSVSALASALVRKPAGIIDPVSFDEQENFFKDGPGYPCPDMNLVEPVTASVLNTTLPLKVLCTISEQGNLPPNVRTELHRSNWVRAILLERSDVASALSLRLEKEVPQLKPFLQQYRKSVGAEGKRFQAVFTCLKFPGMSPYLVAGNPRGEGLEGTNDYEDNWWGMAESDRGYLGQVDKEAVRGIAFKVLNSEQLMIAAKEQNQLRLAAPAPNYMAREVLRYANSHPKDSRIPEALHLSVVATRYGAKDEKTTGYSKSCFQLLHRKYPQSSWTKKTPYYY